MLRSVGKRRLARAYLVALLVSLLFHAAAVVWSSLVLFRPGDKPGSALQPPPSEWVIVDVVPAPPGAPDEAAPAPKKRRAPKDDTRRGPSPEKEQAPHREPGELPADAPRANVAPPVAPGITAPTADGHTLRPDDPSLRPEVLRAEEEQRVKRRVEGFAQDDLAERRAQGGLPHPYFAGVRDGARAELQAHARELKISRAQGLSSAGHDYANAMQEYGANGDPNLGASGGPAPTPESPGSAKNAFAAEMANSSETQQALRRDRPLMTLKLELRQFRDGSPLRAVVLEPSGDPGFDTFVLDTWTRTLTEQGPPPEDAFHGPMLRTIWAVEGWLGLPKKLETATSYLPMPAGTDKLAGALTQEGFHYEFRTKLLSVYQ